MGIRINHNLFSQLVTRNLNKATASLEKTYEKLSTGQRINQSGDDPAGLATSHALRNEVRGMRQTIRNATDGLSVISTAEAALTEVTEILQRLRELTIQAGNSTLSYQNRQDMQTEAVQLLAEIQRISESAEFNGRRLLNGVASTTKVQVGTKGSQFIPVQLPDVRIASLGQRALVTGANAVSPAPIAGGGDLTINGQIVPASAADGVSNMLSTSSAIAKARAINEISSLTGVRAQAAPAVYVVPGAAISALVLNGTTNSLTINGVNIGAVAAAAGDSEGSLRQAINTFSNQTGVTASLDPSGALMLTAKDGRNFDISTTGSVADELGLAIADGDLSGYIQMGRVELSSGGTITVGGDPSLIGFAPAQTATSVDPATALAYISILSEDLAADALDALDQTLADVLAARADLGAVQNRLNSSINSLMVSVEELSASDSKIIDTDFAAETARLTQLQILQEAGVAILAQANMLPKTALNLLSR